MDALIVDQEFQRLIPPLADEEKRQLEENILKDGCRDPLVVWKQIAEMKCRKCGEEFTAGTPDDLVHCDHCDHHYPGSRGECGNCHKAFRRKSDMYPMRSGHILIDGHNRYEICTRHRLSFGTREMVFSSRRDVLLWIIDNQFGRRNLADIDRIALGEKREDILRPIAKANQIRKPESVSANSPKQKPVDTRKEAAKAAGVGERTYDDGKLILNAAKNGEIEPEVVEAVRQKKTSIHRVAKDIKEKRQADKRQQQRKEAASKVEPQFFDNIHVGDFRDHASKVADGSVSLIFTDPPYDRDSIKLLPDLAKFAESKLCEGGSMLCYVGHIQLPDAFKAFSEHLRYWWTVCCLHSGGNSLMKEYGIRVGWKAVLWFVKGTRDNKSDIVLDVMSGGKEKTHHDWQQAQSEAEYWIDHLCPSDGVVCDPFLGGGTTAAAAIKLNRKWVAFEKDHDQAVLAMARCKK